MRAARKRVYGDIGRARVPTSDDIFALEEVLLSHWADGRISMKDLTELAHYITNAGGRGVEKYAADPKASGENHARRFREGVDLPHVISSSLTFVPNVPIWDEQNQKRELVSFPIRLPFDVLETDAVLEPDTYNIKRIDESDWKVDSFTKHEVTVRHGPDGTIPLGFYSDKVAYTKKKSFLRLSIGCLWKRAKKTCFVIQCEVMCKCGCRGRCTIDPILIACNESMNRLQRGESKILGPCAIVEYRGDWPERAERAGFKTHQGYACCPDCDCDRTTQFKNLEQCTVHHLPWGERTHASYLNDLKEQLIRVRVDTPEKN